LQVVQAVNEEHENKVFLPGYKCPESLRATGDMAAAIAGAEILLMVIPTPFVAATLGAPPAVRCC
jgi:glycerol-3-phosphate dehydrogenase (NAD(P)+)